MSTPGASADRRVHTRYALPVMYTAIGVRPGDCDAFRFEGHAYDISLGGIRFELDEPLAPGSTIGVRIDLPGFAAHGGQVDARPIYALANVVWLEDEDEPGPYRMAAVFTRFALEGDEQRLARALAGGRYQLAA